MLCLDLKEWLSLAVDDVDCSFDGSLGIKRTSGRCLGLIFSFQGRNDPSQAALQNIGYLHLLAEGFYKWLDNALVGVRLYESDTLDKLLVLLELEAVVVGFDNVPRQLVLDVFTVGLLLAQHPLDLSIFLAKSLDLRLELGDIRVFFVGDPLEGRTLLRVVDGLAIQAVFLRLSLG